MNDFLPDTAPGFDQPIAVLKHCHGRIRKQLATLERLLSHLPEHGADEAARQAAGAVLKYFEKAAHLHHDDEEQDLIPMLRAVAQGEDAATLQALAPIILQDHKEMDALWQDLHEQLTAIADGSAATLTASNVQRFVQRYTAHMEREESTMAPMAVRLFSPEQMTQLGTSMQRRRGLGETPAAPAIGDAVASLRKDYGQASLNEDEVLDDPMQQFTQWFEQAIKAQVNEPNAMNVATVAADGRPSSRIVLVKQFDARGFTWYTNYDSRKAQELRANPYAALLFFWSELERQVRIEGRVETTSAEESDKYFGSRPLKSRLSAIASQQSAPIDNRAALERNYEAVAAVAGDAPARPSNWGGFRLVPERIEFWQGRRSRFHDRIVYERQEDGSWARQRLQP
ncbi:MULTISPECIES: pyridoxamine 5'-phosphate oxidase [unclassified Massilia]|uniref:pyridoxamine 5'-phosphate oxidase n=1 Tax=unclassified Massilia TaxID=2609279 RepID=UPI00177BE66C|nr:MULTISPECIES: pyridoxamine 5'-phosphate oxidase [unclassified Massilia]MBD8532729.1 pyridoxamine 5'-phosphate oxidase [Massilia sp. CFBP 13647]MBD8676154.1 pyridoxamine 5'-phosphate oxidase [Massilia sp. CFBP 13721]